MKSGGSAGLPTIFPENRQQPLSGNRARALDHQFMACAFELAKSAEAGGEIPIGAVVVKNNKIIGEGSNCAIAQIDATGHAEIMAIRHASKGIANYRLNNTTLYVTLEPCIMCAGAILHARVERVVFAAHDEKFGAVGSRLNLLQSDFLNHQCRVSSGIMADECQELIQQFFKSRR